MTLEDSVGNCAQYVRARDVMSAEIDAQIVLYAPTDERFYALNRTAGCIWDLLPPSDGQPLAADRLVEALLADFDVDRETCMGEVEQQMARFVEIGVAVPVV